MIKRLFICIIFLALLTGCSFSRRPVISNLTEQQSRYYSIEQLFNRIENATSFNTFQCRSKMEIHAGYFKGIRFITLIITGDKEGNIRARAVKNNTITMFDILIRDNYAYIHFPHEGFIVSDKLSAFTEHKELGIVAAIAETARIVYPIGLLKSSTITKVKETGKYYILEVDNDKKSVVYKIQKKDLIFSKIAIEDKVNGNEYHAKFRSFKLVKDVLLPTSLAINVSGLYPSIGLRVERLKINRELPTRVFEPDFPRGIPKYSVSQIDEITL